MCWSKLSCLQVNRPFCNETGKILIIWDSVTLLLEHKGQEPIFLLPHLTRLDGVASELVLSLAAKYITFLGILRIMLCQVTELCSSIRSSVNSTCRVSCFTLLFHFSRTSSLIERLLHFSQYSCFSLWYQFMIGELCHLLQVLQ